MSFKTTGNSFSPPRTVQEVTDRLRFLGYLGGEAESIPKDALAKAKAQLAEQVAAGRREMLAADKRNPNKL